MQWRSMNASPNTNYCFTPLIKKNYMKINNNNKKLKQIDVMKLFIASNFLCGFKKRERESERENKPETTTQQE